VYKSRLGAMGADPNPLTININTKKEELISTMKN